MSNVTDTDIEVILACAESPVLSDWLVALNAASDAVRQKSIDEMTSKMRADQVDAPLIAAVGRLSEKAFFAAFFQTWNEAK